MYVAREVPGKAAQTLIWKLWPRPGAMVARGTPGTRVRMLSDARGGFHPGHAQFGVMCPGVVARGGSRVRYLDGACTSLGK